jgi:pimeloyl-ACP methyl ester carboxylesterase
MADDIAALIRHLGLEKADVMGYSLGGGVALFTAVRHPELVDRLVMVSANVRRDAIPAEMLAQQEQVGAGRIATRWGTQLPARSFAAAAWGGLQDSRQRQLWAAETSE